jgi:hypothetical protein
MAGILRRLRRSLHRYDAIGQIRHKGLPHNHLHSTSTHRSQSFAEQISWPSDELSVSRDFLRVTQMLSQLAPRSRKSPWGFCGMRWRAMLVRAQRSSTSTWALIITTASNYPDWLMALCMIVLLLS